MSISFQDFEHSTDRTWSDRADFANALLGLAGEAGEVADLGKKELYHGKEVDTIDYIHEVGDVLFYLARIAREKGFSLEQAAIMNIAKLRARYPDGFEQRP